MAIRIFLQLFLLSIITLSQSEVNRGSNSILWSSLTPLQLAAMEGRAEEIESILQQKKEPANSGIGVSPLHWAALRGHVPAIRALLRHHADVNSLDEERNTPLHMGAVSGNPEAVQELVLAMADLNKQNNNNSTALHLAVKKQDFEMVKMLLRFGAMTDVTDHEGRSPLDLAVETNNLIVTALLRSSGAKKIKYGQVATTTMVPSSPTTPSTPITTTVKPSQFEIPKATRRPEVRKLTEEETELHEASKKYEDTRIAELCAGGVNPNVADIQNNGYTAVHLAASKNAKVSLLALARCSANLNVKDLDGNTPLHIAVINNYPWTSDMLLMLGANPNIINNKGESPKDLVTDEKNSFFQATFKPQRLAWMSNVRALSEREQEFLRLVKNGHYLSIADSCKDGVDLRVKDVDRKQYSWLHHAVAIKSNVPGTLQMLILCGADVNARDANGNTPLHLAVTGKLAEAQSVLLLNGADPSIANNAGKTPYQILKESSSDVTESRLLWYRNGMLV